MADLGVSDEEQRRKVQDSYTGYSTWDNIKKMVGAGDKNQGLLAGGEKKQSPYQAALSQRKSSLDPYGTP